MPVISSKVSQREPEAIAECANQHGTTISNLIRTSLLCIASKSNSGNNEKVNQQEVKTESKEPKVMTIKETNDLLSRLMKEPASGK